MWPCSNVAHAVIPLYRPRFLGHRIKPYAA
jgi:hypothetical protein